MARPTISRLLGGRGGSPLMPRRAARLTIRLVESFGTVDPVSPPPPDAAMGFAGGRVLCWRRGLPAPRRWHMHRRVGWFVSSPLHLSGRRSLDSWERRRCTTGHDRAPARRAPLGQWPSRPRSDALRWHQRAERLQSIVKRPAPADPHGALRRRCGLFIFNRRGCACIGRRSAASAILDRSITVGILRRLVHDGSPMYSRI